VLLVYSRLKMYHRRRKNLKTLNIAFLDFILESLPNAHVSLPCSVCLYKYVLYQLLEIEGFLSSIF
jgi:hypothetical protein